MRAAKSWNSGNELFVMVQRELFACMVGDVMDKLNLEHHFSPLACEIKRQVLSSDYGAGIGHCL